MAVVLIDQIFNWKRCGEVTVGRMRGGRKLNCESESMGKEDGKLRVTATITKSISFFFLPWAGFLGA